MGAMGVVLIRDATFADSDPEGEELKDWRPVIQGSSSLSDLPQEPDQAKQSTELPGAASLGSSAAYELEPVEPHGGDPEDAATLQQPHHVCSLPLKQATVPRLAAFAFGHTCFQSHLRRHDSNARQRAQIWIMGAAVLKHITVKGSWEGCDM